MSFLGLPQEAPPPDPITGSAYLVKLQKYLQANATRLAPTPPNRGPATPSMLQQSYTLLTLGLDPNSAPLSRNLKIPLTLGFGTPAPSPSARARAVKSAKPLLLRLSPDRLLYLMLRWQSLPQSLPHVGRTDVPIENGVPVAARGARVDERRGMEGDVRSVSSWVGSMRSVSLGSMVSKEGGRGWFGRKEEVNEDQILLALYTMFTILPALLIHPPFVSEPPILDLIEAGGYTQLGGIDVRVPLDVLRNLQILELEAYDPRAMLVPPSPGLRSLTVRDAQDGDDWIVELLLIPQTTEEAKETNTPPATDDSASPARSDPQPRFPNLRHLSLIRTTLLSFPSIPFVRLTHLDLSHNLLDSLPSSLSLLSSLISLNLSNNVITSLRNAPSVLGNITSLNLSQNRIDCLIGLERVRGLERIDVRYNELSAEDEVGRLAELPHVKEVWCASNPFDQARTKAFTEGESEKEEWRIEVGSMFRSEGKEVLLDDVPFSWSESRRIDGLLVSRGKKAGAGAERRSFEHTHSHTHSHSHPNAQAQHYQSLSRTDPSTSGPSGTVRSTNGIHSSTSAAQDQSQSRQSSIASRQPTRTTLASPSSNASAIAKKKGRRRVIRLDSEAPVLAESAEGGTTAAAVGPGRVDRVEEDDLESRLDGALSLRGERGEQKRTETVGTNASGGGGGGSGTAGRVGRNTNGNGGGVREGQGDPGTASSSVLSPEPEPAPAIGPEVKSVKVSTKRRSTRKGLAKDTFVPLDEV